MSDPRFGRIPAATQRSGMSRSKLYEIAGQHPGLFRKAGAVTLVDLQLLDEILADLPPAVIAIGKEVETLKNAPEVTA
jgi:hypothetical protein